ncbi:two-component system sensor histidine kinase TctE [Mitsuaria sp. BK045]|nr:two-component system sensor histidine kinase TctE [Mitsuaria sp. BK041]MBB3361628.1 two-component system sensor histidine kinase TctE [Mitsuaria sp. BK045]
MEVKSDAAGARGIEGTGSATAGRGAAGMGGLDDNGRAGGETRPPATRSWTRRRGRGLSSMRSRLLLGILVPVGLLIGANAHRLYQDARRAIDTAYDRTLLASAKTIGEQLDVQGTPEAPRLVSEVPYAALEAFEADNRSRMFYRVTGFQGEWVSGFDDLPAWHGRLPDRGAYAALVDFYDDVYQGEPVRIAVLKQPVAGAAGLGVATIQVAETLEIRRTLARQVLVSTLWRQAALLAVIAIVVWGVVLFATRPVRALSRTIAARADDDVDPIPMPGVPAELAPLVAAINEAWHRQAGLLAHQKRFVRDTSHQLRTPLAVLKAQVQSARRGDVPAAQAIDEIGATVDGATALANQMLALAKVEQLRQQGDPPRLDLAATVREVALDLAPLIADAELDFELSTEPAPVRGHAWALRELARNLLHNALRHCPRGGRLAVAVTLRGREADGSGATAGVVELRIGDSGPGIPASLRAKLGQPFAAGPNGGSGLGLAICREIVGSLGGTLALDNRERDGVIEGLDAVVRLPAAASTDAGPA